jgi:7,8-dihydro-6-hydroxymethylpterin-pyrophosphokinase
MPRVGIALGSNLRDRLAKPQAASRCLREIAVHGSVF